MRFRRDGAVRSRSARNRRRNGRGHFRCGRLTAVCGSLNSSGTRSSRCRDARHVMDVERRCDRCPGCYVPPGPWSPGRGDEQATEKQQVRPDGSGWGRGSHRRQKRSLTGRSVVQAEFLQSETCAEPFGRYPLEPGTERNACTTCTSLNKLIGCSDRCGASQPEDRAMPTTAGG
jgi:hypothetical protein